MAFELESEFVSLRQGAKYDRIILCRNFLFSFVCDNNKIFQQIVTTQT